MWYPARPLRRRASRSWPATSAHWGCCLTCWRCSRRRRARSCVSIPTRASWRVEPPMHPFRQLRLTLRWRTPPARPSRAGRQPSPRRSRSRSRSRSLPRCRGSLRHRSLWRQVSLLCRHRSGSRHTSPSGRWCPRWSRRLSRARKPCRQRRSPSPWSHSPRRRLRGRRTRRACQCSSCCWSRRSPCRPLPRRRPLGPRRSSPPICPNCPCSPRRSRCRCPSTRRQPLGRTRSLQARCRCRWSRSWAPACWRTSPGCCSPPRVRRPTR